MTDCARRFIRHPTSIPLDISVDKSTDSTQIKDVGAGGLCFLSQHPIAENTPIQITIPIFEPKFDINGIVRWCNQEGSSFLIGVAFQQESAIFDIPLIEQICHIENYREQCNAEKGMELSSEEAAREWIEKYAATFPKLTD